MLTTYRRPKLFCQKYYWHQQFERSTGDKTHTSNILPGGETFVPTRGKEAKIKQISYKYQINTNYETSKKPAIITQSSFRGAPLMKFSRGWGAQPIL